MGGLLTLSPQYCFLLDDNLGLCGYALATLDSKSFQNHMEAVYDVEMQEKYPKPDTQKSLSPHEVSWPPVPQYPLPPVSVQWVNFSTIQRYVAIHTSFLAPSSLTTG